MRRVRAAVDTSVLVNFLTGGADRDEPHWLDHGKWVFEAQEQQLHDIVIPAIVIAEVAGCGEVRGAHLDSGLRSKRIKKVLSWLDESDFITAEISRDVARRAATLAVKHQLTGSDACVLAVAEVFGCERLYTWDRGLLKVGTGVDGLSVERPERILPAQNVLVFET
jgi:predicted nucleic acid-binding protein